MHDGFASPHPGAPDDSYIWRRYDWGNVSTVAVYGTLSAALYCHAHAHGARVTFGYRHAPWETNFTRIWRNSTLVAAYARSLASQTLDTHTDGWSLDIEAPVRDPKDAGQLTALVRAISEEVRGALPSAQVTFASDILGFESRADQYDVDLVGISRAVDYLVVMCYDAAKNLSAPDFSKANMALPLLKKGVAQYAAHGIGARKLILAMPWYAYSWKCSANKSGEQDCGPAHLLCHCTMGYSMANNSIGHRHGNASDPGDVRDCSNDCQPTGYAVPGGLPCLTVAGIEQVGAISAVHWDEASSTPWLRWQDPVSDPPPTVLELWFENPRSLALKAAFAHSVGAGGVSMWGAGSLDYTNASQVAAFWGSFTPFTAGQPRLHVGAAAGEGVPPSLEKTDDGDGVEQKDGWNAVFKAGEPDERGFRVNSFRIPGFVVANSTLLVAAEARLYSWEDTSPHHLVLKRSLDRGKTWGPLQTVVTPSGFVGGTSGAHGDVLYDPTLVFDAVRSRVHMIFSYQASRYVNWTSCRRVSNTTGPSTLGAYLGCSEVNASDPMGQQLFAVTSEDLGETWSRRVQPLSRLGLCTVHS